MNDPETQELEVLASSDNGHALEALSRAEIDIQIATAKKFPRPALSKIKADMLSIATMDEDTAASCVYALPRGNKIIKGPSVRLAEIAMSCYGNIRAGTRVISTEADGPTPHVIVQGVCHDLEKNIAISLEKPRRITKKKSKPKPDEDDVTLATNACGAIAFRDAIYKVIPKILILPVYEAAKKVAVGEVKSLAVKRQKVLERLRQMGVMDDRIFARLDVKKADDIDLEKLEILIGLGTALKDGDTSLEEAFPPIDGSQLVKVDAEAKLDDSNPELQPGKPESQSHVPDKKATSETKAPEQKRTPQMELEICVTEGGFTFEELRRWLIASGNIPDADSLAGFSEIKEADAIRLNRAKVGLLGQLKKQKEGQ